MQSITTKRIAVVGSGVAGLGAAWALSRRYHVTLFESEVRLGGHSRTIDVVLGSQLAPVDTGFIVFNELNYPNLTRLFDYLDVSTMETDMSFAVSRPGFEFSASARGLLTDMRSLRSRRTWAVVRGIARFRRDIARDQAPDGMSLGEYLRARRYSDPFVDDYLIPLTAAVWSGSAGDVSRMPAAAFLDFISNHGLFDVKRPQWRTVRGGSREYVERLAKEIPVVHAGTAVRSLDRSATGATLHTSNGSDTFDEVVLATHAPTTTKILGSGAKPAEREILGAFSYAPNRAVVHTDSSFMPRRQGHWSSWNSIRHAAAADDDPVAVTYWMNRLQGLDRRHGVFITLNPHVDPKGVIDDVEFAHPQFSTRTLAAQQRLGAIQGVDRVWYAGAWTGYGFHEDGLQSGLTVAAALGSPAPWHDDVTPSSSAARHAAPSNLVAR